MKAARFIEAPVWLACGIGLYFWLPVEPVRAIWVFTGISILVLLPIAMRWPAVAAVAPLVILAGFGIGGIRTNLVAAPILEGRYYGAVEGRVIALDRSASSRLRITLDRVVLEDRQPEKTPQRVRISLHSKITALDPAPGQTVIVTAFLSAPDGPVEPGGFDFRRMAYFKRLGAVGYARAPVLLLQDAPEHFSLSRLRHRMSRAVQKIVPGDVGAFAAAITTGDRAGLSETALQALRATNLAHLLAISGMHMGMLTGLVYAALRVTLVALPAVGSALPVRAVAAAGGLAAGGLYLALSGGNVATQRAFIMAAVVFVGLIAGRRALTLRAVALAAMIVLTLRPEALAGPGFQMSFAATTALVLTFRSTCIMGRLPRGKVRRWALSLLLSSGVAGAATLPISAYHFNQIAQFGLLANLLAVPLLGLVVMPAAITSALLAPFGVGEWGVHVMALGIGRILAVAHWIAAFEGAVRPVRSPMPVVLPLLSFGFLGCVLGQRVVKLGGVVLCAIALTLWTVDARPDLVIDGRGALVGIQTEAGRALSRPRGGGFAARVWLENDGTPMDQSEAAGLPGWSGPPKDREASIGRWRIRHRTGGDGPTADLCYVEAEQTGVPVCVTLNERLLQQTGAVSIADAGRAVLRTAQEVTGRRPWSVAKALNISLPAPDQ
ncbi:ComEC/Rec2 family competence protein [Palleronia caenipelagi]|uniref:ComEC family competence protein n=1 Tax=Palleronia caenipelagi TaxID=2489174 RepID=A0A547Q9B4_9RHOB|nr:ComEC/Rec2 family competence protein [Palleronia caenipelagi]TRD22977.1 ComEC family competence protein [Palleronia caenipelagi]